MRHKYETRGVVLARAPFGEGHARLALLTEELGLVHARAAGVRAPKSKLAHALVTFAESEVTLVAGREGWRVTGAVLATNWFAELKHAEARRRAARVTGLLLRLAPDELAERGLFAVTTGFLRALAEGEGAEAEAEGAELLAAARLLGELGFDEAERGATRTFTTGDLRAVAAERERYVARINRGIAASGL